MLEFLNPELAMNSQAGARREVGELYDRFAQGVYRFLVYRTGDPQAADDLTSEVFLKALRALPDLRARPASLQAWLFQIARNLAIDHYRKQRLRDHAALDEALPAAGPAPDADLEQRLTSELLRRALERLSPDQRDVITLRFVSSLPTAEVALTLHKSEDAVKGLQRRGLAQLRQLLAEMEISYG
jgi:RNA polymerase sigma-70 factor (ECF subfamily)